MAQVTTQCQASKKQYIESATSVINPIYNYAYVGVFGAYQWTVASAKKQKMKRQNQNKETALSKFLDNIQQDKFLALYGMLKSGVSPYSNRFLLYWEKQPPKNHSKNVAIAIKKKGLIPFDDAWKILDAFHYN